MQGCQSFEIDVKPGQILHSGQPVQISQLPRSLHRLWECCSLPQARRLRRRILLPWYNWMASLVAVQSLSRGCWGVHLGLSVWHHPFLLVQDKKGERSRDQTLHGNVLLGKRHQIWLVPRRWKGCKALGLHLEWQVLHGRTCIPSDGKWGSVYQDRWD